MENKSKKKQYVLVDVKVTTFEPESAILVESNYLETTLVDFVKNSQI